MTCEPFCERCGGHLGHAANGDWVCQKCKEKEVIPEPTEALIAAGVNAVCSNSTRRGYYAEILRNALPAMLTAMEAAREPEAGKLREALEQLLPNIAQMLDEMRTERQNGDGLAWTDWNQAQRDELTRVLALSRNQGR